MYWDFLFQWVISANPGQSPSFCIRGRYILYANHQLPELLICRHQGSAANEDLALCRERPLKVGMEHSPGNCMASLFSPWTCTSPSPIVSNGICLRGNSNCKVDSLCRDNHMLEMKNSCCKPECGKEKKDCQVPTLSLHQMIFHHTFIYSCEQCFNGKGGHKNLQVLFLPGNVFITVICNP